MNEKYFITPENKVKERISKGDRGIVNIPGRPDLSGQEVVVTRATRNTVGFESEFLNSQGWKWVVRTNFQKLPKK